MFNNIFSANRTNNLISSDWQPFSPRSNTYGACQYRAINEKHIVFS